MTTANTATLVGSLHEAAQAAYQVYQCDFRSAHYEARLEAYKQYAEHPDQLRLAAYNPASARYRGLSAERLAQLEAELTALAESRGLGEVLAIDSDVWGSGCVVATYPRFRENALLVVPKDVPAGTYPAIDDMIGFRSPS